MADFAFLSIVELGRLLRQKKTSATELATYFLDRLERIGPRYNAVVTVTRERALGEAAQADREIKAGKWRGPLHGIPYGVKDLLATKDYPTTWGAEPYRQQKLDHDATVVERLGAAGAVLVAKLAMVELAGGMGYNQANASFTGPGKTPWNPNYWAAVRRADLALLSPPASCRSRSGPKHPVRSLRRRHTVACRVSARRTAW